MFGPPDDFMYHTLAQFAGAVKGLGWQMILKFHPGASDEINIKHTNVVRKLGTPGVATKDNFEACLMAANVVASYGPSNGLIEAAILDKPTLCVGGEEAPFQSVPADPDAISITLSALQYEGAQPGVRDLAAHVGEATEQVADLISEVCDLDGIV